MSRPMGSKNKIKEVVEDKKDIRDNKGRFTKGNNSACFRNPEKQAIKDRISSIITEDSLIDGLKDLVKEKNASIRLQAISLCFQYLYGKPKQIIESDQNISIEDKRQIPLEVQNLLMEISKKD